MLLCLSLLLAAASARKHGPSREPGRLVLSPGGPYNTSSAGPVAGKLNIHIVPHTHVCASRRRHHRCFNILNHSYRGACEAGDRGKRKAAFVYQMSGCFTGRIRAANAPSRVMAPLIAVTGRRGLAEDGRRVLHGPQQQHPERRSGRPHRRATLTVSRRAVHSGLSDAGTRRKQGPPLCLRRNRLLRALVWPVATRTGHDGAAQVVPAERRNQAAR